MSQLPGTPLVWSPMTAADTIDSSTSQNGAMSALQNLIPDPTTRALWYCRPAAVKVTDLVANGGFAGATFISAVLNVGTRIYGMVSTSRNPGHDEPFCYDVPSQTYTPISGVTAANTPISPATFGNWNPPTMTLVGSKIIVSHPGFNGTGGAFFGVIDVLNPFALAWSATNTSPTALIFPPTWVANFNGRCYFLVNPPNTQPAAYFSDVLNPTTITFANQILTFGDNTPLTVAAGLSLSNQLGGIIQALMVFKGVTNIFQVTGDYALQNLSINSLNVATGTFAPNSVVSSEKGLIFMAPDGVRLIDFNAKVTDPIGKDGDGITVPFLSILVPSRTNALFNVGIYRVQVQNGSVIPTGGAFSSGFSNGFGMSPVVQQQEWWYDFVRGNWSGPHTTRMSLGIPYQNTFLITIQNAGAVIFQSDQVQSFTSTFVENGVPLTYNWQTAYLPDTDQMSEVAMIETTLHMALVSGQTTQINLLSQDFVLIDSLTVAPAGDPTLWNQFNWNQAKWNGSSLGNNLYPRRLSWHFPIVFRRLSMSASGVSAAGIKIGRLHMRYQVLGYLQMDFVISASTPIPPPTTQPFVLDHSTLGGPDVLGS